MATSPTGKSQVLIAVTFLISAPYRVQADPRVLQVQVAQTETKYRERGASKQSLIPVPSPNLNGMEKIVQEQIRAAESKLTASLQKSGATTVDLSQAYGEMGKLYQAYDLKDAALACYLNAERLNPGNFAWQYYLGYLYQMKGDLEQSVVYFTNALKIQPHDQATLLRSAQTELDLNRRELAKILFQQALTLDSSCAAGMAGLGKIALSERRYADAVKHFNRALALQPHASGIEYQLALAYR